MLVKEFVQICMQISPLDLQESWDNSGPQIIFPDQKVSKVLLATDLSTNTLNEAIKTKSQLMVIHHPPIFKPFKSLDFKNPFHKLLMVAIQKEISLLAMHTNFDATATGMNQYLLNQMGIKKSEPLMMQPGNYLKLIVFVPKTHTEIVRKAICDAGAGHIGNYSDCSFKTVGTGTFKGQKDTNPFLGKPEQLESAEEDRLETILKNSDKSKVLKAMLATHPYEEVAYDLISLSNEKPGLGRIGYLEKQLEPKKFIALLKKKLKINDIRFSHCQRPIQKVAIITGGAGSYYTEAVKAKCDAFISGDIKHNQWLEANELNFLLVDATHFGTEKFFSACLVKNLKNLKIKSLPSLVLAKSEKFPFAN